MAKKKTDLEIRQAIDCWLSSKSLQTNFGHFCYPNKKRYKAIDRYAFAKWPQDDEIVLPYEKTIK
jgi:hypothetical protein